MVKSYPGGYRRDDQKSIRAGPVGALPIENRSAAQISSMRRGRSLCEYLAQPSKKSSLFEQISDPTHKMHTEDGDRQTPQSHPLPALKTKYQEREDRKQHQQNTWSENDYVNLGLTPVRKYFYSRKRTIGVR
jgi:hypothetical protein